MTIIEYSSLPLLSVTYIHRDSDSVGIGVWVTNQETKERLFFDAVTSPTSFFYADSFDIDITTLLDGVDVNTTFLVEAIDEDSNPLYRDIVVFSDRMDMESDYEQNDDTEEYIYA